MRRREQGIRRTHECERAVGNGRGHAGAAGEAVGSIAHRTQDAHAWSEEVESEAVAAEARALVVLRAGADNDHMGEVEVGEIRRRIARGPEHRCVARADIHARCLDRRVADSRVTGADDLGAVIRGPLDTVEDVVHRRAAVAGVAHADRHDAEVPTHAAHADAVVAARRRAARNMRAVSVDIEHVGPVDFGDAARAVVAEHSVLQVLVWDDAGVGHGDHDLVGAAGTGDVPRQGGLHGRMVPLLTKARIVRHATREEHPVWGDILKEA